MKNNILNIIAMYYLSNIFKDKNIGTKLKRGSKYSAGLDIIDNSVLKSFCDIDGKYLYDNKLELIIVSRSSLFKSGYYTASFLVLDLDKNIYSLELDITKLEKDLRGQSPSQICRSSSFGLQLCCRRTSSRLRPRDQRSSQRRSSTTSLESELESSTFGLDNSLILEHYMKELETIRKNPFQMICHKKRPVFVHDNTYFPDFTLNSVGMTSIAIDLRLDDSFPRNMFIRIRHTSNKCFIDGIIDADYRGVIHILAYIKNKISEPTDEELRVKYGIDYIAEVYEYVKFADELNSFKVDVRTGGFGSTGDV